MERDEGGNALNILFIGDVFGRPGREALASRLPQLLSDYDAHLCIANGENSAGGKGLTYDVAQQLYDSGVDAITLGNHTWDNRSIFSFIEHDKRIVRPANYPPGTPGRGSTIVKASDGTPVVIAQLLCRLFMNPVDCPFHKAEVIYEQYPDNKIFFLDLHGESTSEKIAMAWKMDGRFSAVIGTHTHVQTADERIMPDGTAFLTDAGMSGAHDSVIGMDIDTAVANFVKGIRQPFKIAKDNVKIRGVFIRIDKETGKALQMERIQIDVDSAPQSEYER
ncbi:TIGR00282 family metallophosphoesterase [bacterium]|nr:TIGR00282 family metallophosphoesterase [bacterium]